MLLLHIGWKPWQQEGGEWKQPISFSVDLGKRKSKMLVWAVWTRGESHYNQENPPKIRLHKHFYDLEVAFEIIQQKAMNTQQYSSVCLQSHFPSTHSLGCFVWTSQSDFWPKQCSSELQQILKKQQGSILVAINFVYGILIWDTYGQSNRMWSP
jgi:hypothetical protein